MNADQFAESEFDKIDSTETVQGDIVLLNDGEVGIATAYLNASQVEIEQNGLAKYVDKANIIGLLRPKPLAPAVPYTIEDIPPKQLQLNKTAHKYNLAHQTQEEITANPFTTNEVGTSITVVAVLHHTTGHDYYLEDRNLPLGYDVADCGTITAPPSAPIPFPGAGTPYEVKVPLRGYQSGSGADNQGDRFEVVPEGEYYIYRFAPNNHNLVNITLVRNQPGIWVNDSFNALPVPEPEEPAANNYISPRQDSVPTPVEPAMPTEAVPEWKSSYSPLRTDRKPEKFILLKDYLAKDYDGKGENRKIKQYTEVPIYGTFLVDGVVFGRLRLKEDTRWEFYYGIPLAKADGTDAGIVEEEQKLFDTTTDVVTRKATKQLTFRDYEIIALDKVERFAKSIDGIFKRKPNKKG